MAAKVAAFGLLAITGPLLVGYQSRKSLPYASSLTVLAMLTPRSGFFSFDRPDPAKVLQMEKPALVCNPYDEPGYLDWNPQTPRTAQWTTIDDRCPKAPEYFQLLKRALADDPPEPDPVAHEQKQRAIEATNFLRGKSILLLGDSVDRNALHQITDLMGAGVWPSSYANASFVGVPDGWDGQGVPHIGDHWQTEFRIYNGFFYGMDEADEFKWQPDWRPPGKAEDRIKQLFGPFMNSTGKAPDLVSLHSGSKRVDPVRCHAHCL
jgi:hypothetical protein